MLVARPRGTMPYHTYIRSTCFVFHTPTPMRLVCWPRISNSITILALAPSFSFLSYNCYEDDLVYSSLTGGGVKETTPRDIWVRFGGISATLLRWLKQ